MDADRANGKLFLLMLSCGIDVDVVRRLHEGRQGNCSHPVYAMPIIDFIGNYYDYPNLRVSWETPDDWQKLDCHWAFAFNTPLRTQLDCRSRPMLILLTANSILAPSVEVHSGMVFGRSVQWFGAASSVRCQTSNVVAANKYELRPTRQTYLTRWMVIQEAFYQWILKGCRGI